MGFYRGLLWLRVARLNMQTKFKKRTPYKSFLFISIKAYFKIYYKRSKKGEKYGYL